MYFTENNEQNLIILFAKQTRKRTPAGNPAGALFGKNKEKSRGIRNLMAHPFLHPVYRKIRTDTRERDESAFSRERETAREKGTFGRSSGALPRAAGRTPLLSRRSTRRGQSKTSPWRGERVPGPGVKDCPKSEISASCSLTPVPLHGGFGGPRAGRENGSFGNPKNRVVTGFSGFYFL